MSFESNRPEYLRLMAMLLARKIDVSAFIASFHKQWLADCNEEHAQLETWDEQYDELLLEAFHAGKMRVDELGARLRALRGVTDSQYKARELIDHMMTMCDCYRPDDGRMEHEREEYDVDEEALMREAEMVHNRLKIWRDD